MSDDEPQAMIIYWLKHRGTFFPVHQGDSLLGRSPECLIVLPSERVSREHAVVRRIHCGLEIEDLGSRDGTWVNGTRIRRATVLQEGDELLGYLATDQRHVGLPIGEFCKES